jgi:hypothetical protein
LRSGRNTHGAPDANEVPRAYHVLGQSQRQGTG